MIKIAYNQTIYTRQFTILIFFPLDKENYTKFDAFCFFLLQHFIFCFVNSASKTDITYKSLKPLIKTFYIYTFVIHTYIWSGGSSDYSQVNWSHPNTN